MPFCKKILNFGPKTESQGGSPPLINKQTIFRKKLILAKNALFVNCTNF